MKYIMVNIWLNGADTESISPLLVQEDRLLLSSDSLSSLGLIPQGPAVVRNNIEYYALSNFEGLDYRLESPRLYVECPPGCFEKNTLNLGDRRFGLRDRPEPGAIEGAYFNYDLVFQASDNGNEFFRGYLQAGGGLNKSRWKAEGILAEGAGQSEFVRLETSWIREWPSGPHKLVIGDSISDAAGWANPYRFLGVMFGTDHSLQPGYITYPLPNITGDATLPSVVDLYLNGVQFGSGVVQQGPFETGELPLITGGGQLQMNVKDLLGREKVFVQSFYIAPQLLKQGLTKFSLQVGVLRQNYGLDSFNYGEIVVSGRFRHGLDNLKTIELYTEAGEDRLVTGVGLLLMPPVGGVVHVSSALSLGDGDVDSMFSVGYERYDLDWGFAAYGEWRSRKFKLPSDRSDFGAFSHRLQARLSKRFDSRFGFSGSFIRNKRPGLEAEHVVNGNLNVDLARRINLSFTLRQAFGLRKDTLVGMFLSLPLGGRQHLGASYQHSKSGERASLLAHRTPKRTEGWGYRAEVTRGTTPNAEAVLLRRTGIGDFDLGVSDRPDATTVRANARGGVVFWDGAVKAARYITGSYGVVKAPEIGKARVYHDSQYVGRLDDNGRLLITDLRPFERNRIAIESRDIPPGQYLDTYEKIVVPHREAGVGVDFSRDIYLSFIVVVQDEEGEWLPFGTRVLGNTGKNFVIGRRGRLNVRYPAGRYRFLAMISSRTCEFDLKVDPGVKPGQLLKTVTCRVTKPT
ncbi:fimbria/pilus outer membrane usher protein [Emcibacter nanhaiensis]|nr:fimbria/pilus outer membrane usher protein [Emcibacter nanhaiensis]